MSFQAPAKKILTTLALALSLAACGGGDGGGTSTTQPIVTAPDTGTTTPGTTTTPPDANTGNATPKTVQGASFSVPLLELAISKSTNSSANGSVQIFDLNPQVTVNTPVRAADPDRRVSVTTLGSAGAQSISMLVSSFRDLPVGVYEGNVEVHLCSDTTCSGTVRELPAKLPYRLTIVQ
jgi:hypothetical protein